MKSIKLYSFSILLIITLLSNNIFAQSLKKEIEVIRKDTTNYYGIGKVCNSYQLAEESALAELYGNIAKNCNSHAIFLAENGDNQVEKIVSTFEQRIEEKSSEMMVVEDDKDGQYQCFMSLKRSEFREMCSERRKEIQKYLMRGMNSEETANYEDALKSYYWGLMLCYAHPQGKKLRFETTDGQMVDYEWFVDRIGGQNGILNSFNFIIPKENAITEDGAGRTVKIRVTTNVGMPVKNLRCEYHNGKKYVSNTVRDGILVVDLWDKNIKNFKIKVNYTFADDAKKMNAAIHNAMETINIPRFSNNVYVVDIEKTINYKERNELPEFQQIEKSHHVKELDYLGKMQIIEKALRDSNIKEARCCFSKEGFDMLDTLSKYGRMTVVGKPEYKFLKYNDEVICRSITMQFDFRNTTGFSQDVVFRFDTINKVVTSLAFRLSEDAESDIWTKTKWPEQSRLVLINFLEDYQTAYALKRHKYLESIYSDDALIIVGRVIKKTVIPDRMTLKLTEKDVELTKYDKDTYLKNLLGCFKSQDYIRLRFTETEFKKANGSNNEVYGIRVRQEYYSSTYGDVGYLFLLVDLRDKLPKIHVRAWQPDAVELEKLMGLGDVRIN